MLTIFRSSDRSTRPGPQRFNFKRHGQAACQPTRSAPACESDSFWHWRYPAEVECEEIVVLSLGYGYATAYSDSPPMSNRNDFIQLLPLIWEKLMGHQDGP